MSIIFLSEENSTRAPKWLGVKYALVHKDLYDETGLIDALNDFDNIKNNRGLRSIRNFDNIYVYEVVARSKEPHIHK